jgi:hypothetical protein
MSVSANVPFVLGVLGYANALHLEKRDNPAVVSFLRMITGGHDGDAIYKLVSE